MLEKMMLSDEEYENLGKGLAIGAGVGIVVGAMTNFTAFCFTLGGVVGILGSVIYSRVNKHRKS